VLSLLSIGVNSELSIGAEIFRIKNVIPSDIETLSTGWLIAPRVMIRLDDVPATRTVLPGSRVNYRLLIAGDTSSIQQYKNWVKPLLQPGQSLIDVHSQHFTLQDIMKNTENYLQLILLICLLMSGVALSLSTHQYMRRHYSQVALWRSLGASQKQIV